MRALNSGAERSRAERSDGPAELSGLAGAARCSEAAAQRTRPAPWALRPSGARRQSSLPGQHPGRSGPVGRGASPAYQPRLWLPGPAGPGASPAYQPRLGLASPAYQAHTPVPGPAGRSIILAHWASTPPRRQRARREGPDAPNTRAPIPTHVVTAQRDRAQQQLLLEPGTGGCPQQKAHWHAQPSGELRRRVLAASITAASATRQTPSERTVI